MEPELRAWFQFILKVLFSKHVVRNCCMKNYDYNMHVTATASRSIQNEPAGRHISY